MGSLTTTQPPSIRVCQPSEHTLIHQWRTNWSQVLFYGSLLYHRFFIFVFVLFSF